MLSQDHLNLSKSHKSTKVTNTFYDESMELTDSSSIASFSKPSSPNLKGDSPPNKTQLFTEEYEDSINNFLKDQDFELFDKKINLNEDLDSKPLYEDLERIHAYITQYSPQEIDLHLELKPFIPDLIPCIGDIDAFLRIERPDMKPCLDGLANLDEPAGIQSDPFTLDLQLRAVSKAQMLPAVVKSIPEGKVREVSGQIESWMQSVSELHNKTPARRLMELEPLMQVWPIEIEQYISQIVRNTNKDFQLDVDLALDTRDFAQLALILVDIPVKTSLIEALHVMFSLYCEFKNSQHFK